MGFLTRSEVTCQTLVPTTWALSAFWKPLLPKHVRQPRNVGSFLWLSMPGGSKEPVEGQYTVQEATGLFKNGMPFAN